MSTSVTANRINERATITADDILEMAPDVLLVRGCKPSTKTETGLFLPGAGLGTDVPTEQKDHPLRACPVFEVVRMPVELSRGNPNNISVGDVLLCANVVIDPLLGNELGVTNFYMGVLAVVERAARPSLVSA